MTIYERVLALSKPYLGPAAESFLCRQSKAHLKTEGPLLMASQLAELSKWVGIGAELIMEKAKAVELSQKIAALQ